MSLDCPRCGLAVPPSAFRSLPFNCMGCSEPLLSALLAAPRQDHRARLTGTIRYAADWRLKKGSRGDDPDSGRSAHCLRALAAFVERLPEEDPDFTTLENSRRAEDRLCYRLCDDAVSILAGFGLRWDFLRGPQPTEQQCRKLLRRLEGAEKSVRGRRNRQGREEVGALEQVG